jgi:hypothetical protein
MIHERQGLTLGLEPGDYLTRIHARLDDFERHHAVDGLPLLGHEDDAKAALADWFHESVRADQGTSPFASKLVTLILETVGWQFQKTWILFVDLY